jgi:hypothetical protein
MSSTPETPWIIGQSVPWSVAWTGESRFGLTPSSDFPGLLEVFQEENPGAGTPVFAANHASRNKRGMFLHLCHVCGEPTQLWDRWLFPLETGALVTLAGGELRYGCNVPPVHGVCAERAQKLCPHLSRRYAQPVRFPKDDEGRMIPRRDVQPGMEALAQTLPPGVDVMLSCYRLHGPRFSKMVRRMRRDAGLQSGA